MTEQKTEGIAERCRRVAEGIRAAERAAGRAEGSVRLLAVGKTFPAEAVLECARSGQRAFGENYAQEGCGKVDWFRENHPELARELEWHFIGRLQANKTRMVAERFDWVESVDRLKTAERLSAQRPEGMAPLQLLIEVNVDSEGTKAGVEPRAVEPLAQAIAALPRVRLRGLMAIPMPGMGEIGRCSSLRRLKRLFDGLREKHPEWTDFDTLSMGMSSDATDAVTAGTTEVRIGRAIFGERTYNR